MSGGANFFYMKKFNDKPWVLKLGVVTEGVFFVVVNDNLCKTSRIQCNKY